MKNTLKLFIREYAKQQKNEDILVEMHRRSALLRMLVEATARIFNLDQQDIVRLLDDILSGEPVMTYTEKLAGTFFEVQVRNGEAGGRYKDVKKRGGGFWSDEAGVASAIERSKVFEGQNALFQFEVLDPNRVSDYIDYALGNKPLAIEVTGKLTSEQAKALNDKQRSVRFMSQADIIKRPKPLSPELRVQVEQMRDRVASNPKITVDEKKEIENLVSASLVEIFGDSVLGGRTEGLFVTGAGKPFKIPEKGFADIQRLQAPMYAMFSGRGNINQGDIIDRLNSVAGDPGKAQSDRMISDIRNYLEAASKGSFGKGFRTFFTPEEATRLLGQFNQVLQGQGSASGFVRQMAGRIGHKSTWMGT